MRERALISWSADRSMFCAQQSSWLIRRQCAHVRRLGTLQEQRGARDREPLVHVISAPRLHRCDRCAGATALSC